MGANDLKERPDVANGGQPQGGGPYDGDDNSWLRSVGISPDTTRSDSEKNGVNDLRKKEASASNGDGNSSLRAKGETALNSAANSVTGEQLGASSLYKATPAGRLALIASVATRRRAAYGGGIAGLIIAVVMIFIGSSSLYLVNIKESLTGDQNDISRTTSTALERRRTNSLATLIKRGAQEIKTEDLAGKFRAAGLRVEVRSGKITSITDPATGRTLNFDGNARTLAADVQELGRTTGGRNLLGAIDDVADEGVARFSGIVTTEKLYRKVLGLNGFYNWLRASAIREGPGDTPRVLFARGLRNANQTDLDLANARVAEAAADGIQRAEDFNSNIADGDQSSARAGVDNLGEETAQRVDEYRTEIASADGRPLSASSDIADVSSNGSEISEQLTRSASGELDESGFRAFASSFASTKFGSGSLTGLAGAFDITSTPRNACRAKGTLDFVKSVRNTLMAAELMKFTLRAFTIADHQKAGLVDSTAIKLLSLYLAGSTGSSGMQWALSTGAKTGVSAAGIEQYGVGFADVGILSAISSFIGAIPGISPSACSIYASPLSAIGGTVVGGVIAAFTGGTVAGVNLAWSLGLTIANEVAFAYGTSLS